MRKTRDCLETVHVYKYIRCVTAGKEVKMLTWDSLADLSESYATQVQESVKAYGTFVIRA